MTYTDEIAADTRARIGRLMAAWDWLHEARIPGAAGPRPTRPARAETAEQAAERATEYAAARADQVAAVRAGAKPAGEHPVPVALAAVEARQRIAGDVAALAGRMWAALHDEGGLILTIRDRPLTRPCPWCRGRGYALKPDGWPWPWPPHRIVCSLCAGRMVVATGQACQACGAPGPCACDRSDVVLALSLAVVDELLDVAGVESLADACSTLGFAHRHAERAAGAGHDRRALPGHPPPECPACGSRELDAEVSSPDHRRWSVQCRNRACICTGPAHLEPDGTRAPACPCGIATARRRDRPHMWPGSIWDGPNGLARLLGIRAPGTDTPDEHRDRLALAEALRTGRPTRAR